MSYRIPVIALMVLITAAAAHADKVIMKDGKVHEGRIMGETNRSVLISNAPIDPKPRFLNKDDVLTIVRDRHEEIVTFESQRYAMMEAQLGGFLHAPDEISLNPAPGMHVGGGFRLHPAVQIDAGFDYIPAVAGRLLVTDGTLTRGYQRFYAYHLGFGARVFPLFFKKQMKLEPYLHFGYQWSRLVAKSSDDYLKGKSWTGGVGLSRRLRRHLYWESRFAFHYTTYDKILFILREGSLNPEINVPTYSLTTGLAFRL
jgi:hypothetical protein